MKRIFGFLLLFCLFYKLVHGGRTGKVNRPKEIISLDVEPVKYDPDENYLKDGSSKKITCRGSQRYQKIEWYDPNGDQMERNSNNRVFVQDAIAPSLKSKAQSLVLVFKEADVEDSGIWECRSGELVQKVPLCVLDPAEFINTPTEVTIDEGRSITLTCQAKGNPEPKIIWYRIGEVVSESDEKIYISTKYNQHGFEGLLTIKSLTADDAGTYVCEAVQEIPDLDDCSHTDATNITLNVNQRPKFNYGPGPEKPMYIFATDNEVIQLVCDPSAYPTPKYRWFKEVMDVWTEYPEKQFKVSDDRTQSVFTLTANSSTFDQKFRCMATNEYGSTIALYELKKLVKPLRITEYYVSNATDTNIWFNVTGVQDCEPCSIDGFDIQYFEKRTSGSPREIHWKRAHTGSWISDDSSVHFGELEVKLTGLKPETEYWVRLRPFNSLGRAPWSLPLLVTTTNTDFEDYLLSADGELAQPIEVTDYGVFYGFLLVGIIVVAGAICIFFVKRV